MDFKETGLEEAQEKNRWRVLLNMALSFELHKAVGNIFFLSGHQSACQKGLLHGFVVRTCVKSYNCNHQYKFGYGIPFQ
jgi:hypothetical protein